MASNRERHCERVARGGECPGQRLQLGLHVALVGCESQNGVPENTCFLGCGASLVLVRLSSDRSRSLDSIWLIQRADQKRARRRTSVQAVHEFDAFRIVRIELQNPLHEVPALG